MKKGSKARSTKRLRDRFLAAVKNSVIVSGLDRLCIKIYELLCSGIFARAFGARGVDRPEQCSEKRGVISRLRERMSRRIENSRLITKINHAASAVFGLRLRVIGTYLLTFAVYTAIIALVKMIIEGTYRSRFDMLRELVAAVMMSVAAIPFMVSKGTVSGALTSSSIARKLVSLIGFNPDKMWSDEIRGRHLAAFILGTVSGLVTVFAEPMWVFVAIIALIVVYMVLSLPEVGVMAVAFLMPFLPTMVLAGLTIFVAVAFIFKLIRGKRVFRAARIDLFVGIFVVILLLGGLISLSIESIMPAAMFICFLGMYFIVSCCIRSEEWIMRIIRAIITSAMIVALYGIAQYAFGSFGANAWLDKTLFKGITGRAASTLENPNMLGEYLIMLLPTAIALLMQKREGSKKFDLLCAASLGMCLILTWSRGAWLGFMFSAVIFLLIWSKRSVWLFAGGILALPVLPIILPDSIINRFLSIGNMADTSTSYRVHVWRGAVHMLRDNFFSGIGIGEAAWYQLYPEYSLDGIEAAPHSHNLFLQIMIETGVFGLIVFLAILFLFIRMCFNLFARMSGGDVSLTADQTVNTKLLVAGPLCGIAAVLLQGLTDYSWYNYRVFLMFWIVMALVPALVKNASCKLTANKAAADKHIDTDDEASVDIQLSNENN